MSFCRFHGKLISINYDRTRRLEQSGVFQSILQRLPLPQKRLLYITRINIMFIPPSSLSLSKTLPSSWQAYLFNGNFKAPLKRCNLLGGRVGIRKGFLWKPIKFQKSPLNFPQEFHEYNTNVVKIQNFYLKSSLTRIVNKI